jgi:DNA polymerase-3 subunit delta
MTLHLFVGEEDLLIEQGVADLIAQALPEESRALNLDVLDAGSTPIDEVIARLDTFPFFGDRRVVIVKDLQTAGADGQRALEEYLNRGLPPAVAIFTAQGLDRRGRLFKVFQKQGAIHACDPLGWREAPRWVERFTAKTGKRITAQAAQALVALAGTGLRTLALEVEKLAAYVGDRGEITADDVDAVASRLSEASVFSLTDAIGERNLRRAMKTLGDLLQSEHPLPVLGMIARQFRQLVRAKAAGARNEADLARTMGVHPYTARKLLSQARGYRLADFPGIFALLEEADRDIKSTGQPALALETLIVRLCTSAGSSE